MLDHSLLWLGVPILILESLSTKTVRDGDIQLSLVRSKDQSVSNVIGPTNQKTTANLGSAVKQMRKRILHNLKPRRGNLSRLWTVDLILFFTFHFILFFIFLFSYFSIFRTTRVRVISHAVTSVTNWWPSHKTDHGTWENGVEGSGTKWCHTAWTIHAGLMLYLWSFRVGCTVASMDHG